MTMKIVTIDYVDGDEWAALYINGECVRQTHSITPMDVIDALKGAYVKSASFTYLTAHTQWLMESEGGLPHRFEEFEDWASQ